MAVRVLKVGDRIKLVRVPPQVVRDRERFPETIALFEKAVGRLFLIRDIDEHGHAELWLRDDGSEDNTGAADSIWVEPEFTLAEGKSPAARNLVLDEAAHRKLMGETALLSLWTLSDAGAAGPAVADRARIVHALALAGLATEARALAVEGLLAPK